MSDLALSKADLLCRLQKLLKSMNHINQ